MTNTTLDYSLMAFDSYNRGDRPDNENLPDVYNRITEIDLPNGSQAVGFDASVYGAGGEIVIAYRGTDTGNGDQLSADVWNGWLAGSGSVGAQQLEMAIRFYQAVKTDDPDSNAATLPIPSSPGRLRLSRSPLSKFGGEPGPVGPKKLILKLLNPPTDAPPLRIPLIPSVSLARHGQCAASLSL